MENFLSFAGKTVVITGGSRGIGRACAILFASLGANVAISYNNRKSGAEETLQHLASGNHQLYQMNVADAAATKKFSEAVLSHYGRVDILVNNAGVFTEHKIAGVSFEAWQQAWKETIETNLIGISNLCYLFGRQMMAQGGGCIVNISSRGAFRGEPDHPAYGASKAGLNSLTQSLAVALAPYNVRLTALAPGFVDTDMAAPYLQQASGEAIKQQSPLGRVASAEEVARAVALLCAEGIDFITGAIVDFNGASYLRT